MQYKINTKKEWWSKMMWKELEKVKLFKILDIKHYEWHKRNGRRINKVKNEIDMSQKQKIKLGWGKTIL